MIKLFEEFRWMRRRNNKHKDVDPYNEEDWEDKEQIYCDSCGGIIPEGRPLLVLNKKPICSRPDCVMEYCRKYNTSVRALPLITYKQALKLIK